MVVNLEYFSKWYLANKEEELKVANEWKIRNRKLTEEFLAEWPLERLQTMTIDEYVTGKGGQNKSLCYELENGKYAEMYLGIRGAGKFGIYWNKKKQAYCDQKNQVITESQLPEKFAELKSDLLAIIHAGISQDFAGEAFSANNIFYNQAAITTKLLCVYTKGRLFSGVNMKKRPDQQEVWSKLSPLENPGGIYKQNVKITTGILAKHEELDGQLLSRIFWSYRNAVLTDGTGVEKEKMTSYQNPYSNQLIAAKNLIFRGAPGTGKTYLAQEVAADIVSNGRTTAIDKLSQEEQNRIGFVQFHPSYDYTDFVEGLRPTTSEDGVVNFTLKAGSFKAFVEQALDVPVMDGQDNFEEAWEKFFEAVTEASGTGTGYNQLTTLTGKPVRNLLAYERNEMQGVYPAETTTYLNHDQVYNVYRGLPGTPKKGFDAYRKAIVEHLKQNFGLKEYIPATKNTENLQNYVFIIDEINRGEISKIFGELFFSLDPGYRGNKAGVYTQYANLHKNPEEKFYIPKNVYLIGTMNDIDRSVDTFDFAMRRRFTFLEVTAEASAEKMLKQAATKQLMERLNKAIVSKNGGGLSEDYQIGASYFIGVDQGTETTEVLWQSKLAPLLKDYFRGEYKATEKLANLSKAYFMLEDSDETGNIV